MRWRLLLIHWMRTEALLSNDDYKLPKWRWSLKRRLATGTAVYLTFSLMEHAWFATNECYKLYIEVKTCNRTVDDPLELYIKRHVGFVLEKIPIRYNHAIGFAFEYLNFSYTFYWNFLDLFIMLLGISIAFLFERINTRLRNFRGLLLSERMWAEIRFHHVQVSELLRLLNGHIDDMLLLSCFNDGYFILSQMLNITK